MPVRVLTPDGGSAHPILHGLSFVHGTRQEHHWSASERALIDEAKSDQASSNYQPDQWLLCEVRPPHILIAGLNDPSHTSTSSAYFTDEPTLAVCGRDEEKFFKLLQVEKNATHGYRSTVGLFEVSAPFMCAFGATTANSHLGGTALEAMMNSVDAGAVLQQFFVPKRMATNLRFKTRFEFTKYFAKMRLTAPTP